MLVKNLSKKLFSITALFCVSLATSGTAAAAGVITGDNYPAAWKNRGKDSFVTVFGMNRECVSFAAWKIYVDAGGRMVPAGATAPADWAKFSINVSGQWGDAGKWYAYARSHGVPANQDPTVGSIAHWDSNFKPGKMPLGHVGVIKAVNRDGSIDIEQYNWLNDGKYSVVHFAKGDTWRPHNFIHFHGH